MTMHYSLLVISLYKAFLLGVLTINICLLNTNDTNSRLVLKLELSILTKEVQHKTLVDVIASLIE